MNQFFTTQIKLNHLPRGRAKGLWHVFAQKRKGEKCSCVVGIIFKLQAAQVLYLKAKYEGVFILLVLAIFAVTCSLFTYSSFSGLKYPNDIAPWRTSSMAT